jgi:SAM-dependent methyltransferase
MDDPELWRALWLSRINEYLTLIQKRVFFARQALELPDRLPRTGTRLARLIAGFEDQRSKVVAFLRPVITGALAIPSRPEDRPTLAVLECYEHIFRDWVWGAEEIERTRALVEPALGEGVERLAIYGAGAGRLAVDLHRRRGPRRTYALDINPLPLLVADALARGETVELPELPVAPHSDEEVVVYHRLRSTAQVGDGFHWILGDALHAPFAPASLDAVLTSWFIDSVAADVHVTAAAINRVLRPGGRWINVGPLRFKGELSQQYSIEEVHDVVRASSFTIEASSKQDLPYFDSPHSGSRRTETVFLFRADKSADVRQEPSPRHFAPWVSDPRVPIPVSPVLLGLRKTSAFTASMLGLIDGRTTMNDIAAALGQTWQIDAAVVLDQLRAFFAKLPDQGSV